MTAFVALPIPDTKPLEQAFLQNDAKILKGFFPPGGAISISLPDPISFADQVSSEQAYFLFKRIFAIFRTTEFFIDSRMSSLPDEPDRIVKARWSYQNLRIGIQDTIMVFFYFTHDRANQERKTAGDKASWRIRDIRAEKR